MNADEVDVDEVAFADSQKLIRLTALRGTPVEDASCSNCFYFLEPGAPLSYCWQEKLQTLVGRDWWCHFWEMTEDD